MKVRLNKKIGFRENLDHWRPVPRLDPQFEIEMTTRSSDFDLMGHVNNASYFDFVETALSAVLKTGAKIRNIKICYAREMNQSVSRFKSALSEDAGIYKFKIFDENTVFAYGEFETE